MLAIILLPVAVVGIIRINFVQEYIADKVAEYFSDELNTEITIDGFRFTYSGDILLEDFRMKDREGKPLASFNTFILEVNQFRRKQSKINLGIIRISGAEFYFTRVDSTETNLDFIRNYFVSDEPSAQSEFDIYCDRVILTDMSFRYSDLSSDTAKLVYNFNDLALRASGFIHTADSTGINLDMLKYTSPELFDLQHLEMKAGISGKSILLSDMIMNTDSSDMNLSLNLRYDSLKQLSEPFRNNVRINADIERVALVPSEFAIFSESLTGVKDTVFIQGKITGLLKEPFLDDFSFEALPYASFSGKASVSNPMSIDSVFMNLDIIRLFIDPVETKELAERITGREFTLPPQVYNLGDITVQGSLNGRVEQFYAGAVFSTAAGVLVTDINVKQLDNIDKISYNGTLSARNFNLRKLMDDSTFGYAGFTAKLDGQGIDRHAEAVLEANIDSIWINNRRYRDITLRGFYDNLEFDGLVNVQTQRLKFTANGKASFADSVPRYIASVNMPHADLKAIGVLDDSYNGDPVVSTSVMMHMTGNNPDNLDGWISATNSRLKDGDTSVTMKNLSLDIESDGQGYHGIDLKSDFANISAEGKFDFEDILPDLKHVVAADLPAIARELNLKENQKYKPNDHYINFRIDLHDTRELTTAFAPGFNISGGSYVNGTVMVEQQKIMFRGEADMLMLSGLKVKDISIRNSEGADLGMNVYAERIEISDTIGIDRFQIKTRADSNLLRFAVTWDDHSNEDLNVGNISGSYSLQNYPRQKIDFNKSWFTTNDTIWQISESDGIIIDSSGFVFNEFRIGNDYQSISMDGAVSSDSSEMMKIKFHKLNISNFDPFANAHMIDFDGRISGFINARNLLSTHPTFTSDLRIDSIGFNHEHLGDAVIRSAWVDSVQGIKTSLDIAYKGNIGVTYPLKVRGFYYPYDKEENFDFDMTLTNFKLKTIAGYLQAFTSYFQGLASGEMHFRGNFKDPQLLGEVKLMRTVMRIDYLNTVYSIADYVRFNNNEIVFNNVGINDNNSSATRGNKAYLNGKITHNNFKEIEIDLNIDAEKFTVLNTSYSDNEMYYGTAIASGKVDIYGPVYNVTIDVVGKSEAGTRLFIPLSSSSEVSRTDFITFMSPGDSVETITFEDERQENVEGVQLNIDLDATPDAEIQIIFDESIGDIIKAKGSGEVELTVDTRGDFSMYGNYTIEEGEYLFTLENIYDKNFSIEEGGSITWTGDPYEADLDMDAVYTTSARLYDLVSYIDSSDIYKKRRPVDLIIRVEGNLSSPEIIPDIELPNSDEITKQLLKTVLYVNANQVNQQEMNRQFVGLLVLNSFFPPSDVGGAAGGAEYGGLGNATSSTLLSDQLSNWLSQISDDFNVGVNYRPGDEITSEELEIVLSAQLLNDKMTINTNVGVGGNDPTQQTVKGEETSNIVGDLNVEYELTEKLRVKAFNQHNNKSYLDERGPYTQGVGIFYRKEFDTLRELFRRNKKDEKEEKEQEELKTTAETDQATSRDESSPDKIPSGNQAQEE